MNHNTYGESRDMGQMNVTSRSKVNSFEIAWLIHLKRLNRPDNVICPLPISHRQNPLRKSNIEHISMQEGIDLFFLFNNC